MDKVEEVKAWLLLAKHYQGIMNEIEHKIMELVGEEEDCGHVCDFIYSQNTNAKNLIEKVEGRKKLVSKGVTP